MSLDINFAALGAFRNVNFGNADAIANLKQGDGVEQNGKLGSFLGKMFRSSATKANNNAVRTELLKSLGQAFGLSGMSEAGSEAMASSIASHSRPRKEFAASFFREEADSIRSFLFSASMTVFAERRSSKAAPSLSTQKLPVIVPATLRARLSISSVQSRSCRVCLWSRSRKAAAFRVCDKASPYPLP